eukprot:TRINITY_DN23181_c0_g1_i1.p1 TRINITY_DN23181_c0_g1~~TRINITY_DN23181_c0_g1_i1.p1  ORF type:complete len:142 (+),score=38.08 TRINITY_DN23181_c0_g1_i1:394-819(+)
MSKHMMNRQKQENNEDTLSHDNILIEDTLSKSFGGVSGGKKKSFAKSESHLAHLPPVPPKIVPLLPSKQKINKSKEDVRRLDKELLRSSMTALSGRIQKIDEDYDFPNPTEEEDDHELMDYDEPSVSFHQFSLDETADVKK